MIYLTKISTLYNILFPMGILITRNQVSEKHKILLFNELPTSSEVIGKEYLDDIKSYDKDHYHYHSPVDSFYIFKIKQDESLEKTRLAGHKLASLLAERRTTNTSLSLHSLDKISSEYVLAFIEGLLLSSYDPKLLSTKTNETKNTLHVDPSLVSQESLDELLNLSRAVFITRNLVNLPVSHLNSTNFVTEIKKQFNFEKIKIEILEKSQIQSLKMGGLLAVNQGSEDPPYFAIIQYQNNGDVAPISLVGKGVMYDTGGLSLKPTANSMDIMKCDMGGAATVVGTIMALALNNVKTNVTGLIPITDNRPNHNAVAPGDVITMFDGTTVEVMNTDAEGRLILADALTYAKKLNPSLVIDIATLTGSALGAIGQQGTVYMGTANQNRKDKLEAKGLETHERLVEFPLWDEYAEELKSPIADLKNLGGNTAGAITAGKFLQHFIDYEWLHLDIAGPAFLNSPNGYRPKGGTGVGVRLLYNFIKQN